LQDYNETRTKRLEAEKLVKPLQDKEDKLADQICEALHEMKQSSAKRGAFRAVLAAVAGRVSWKDAWESLKLKAEAAGVKVDQPTAKDGERLTVVPVETE
jgi:hypothetical protein